MAPTFAQSAATAREASRKRARVIVVLPAYNEEANLGRLLEKIDDAMAESNFPYQVVVVDDGSHDKTFEILNGYSTQIPLVVSRHDVNQGLGATIRDGLLMASKIASDNDVIVTMDADETHTPGLILRMVRMIREGHDVVIASRYQPGSRVYGVSLPRRLASFSASWLFRVLFPIRGVRDFTCGYRAYRGAVLNTALSRYGDQFLDADGFQCMVDILLKLRKLPVIFGEVPMVLRYDLKESLSKMRVGRTIRQTLALLVIRRLGH